MTTEKEKAESRGSAAPWSVMVVYEDDERRELAVQFCDRLVVRFWSQYSFDVSWWSFALLHEALPADQAAKNAIRADLVIFAPQPEGQLPTAVREWVDTWVDLRRDREGVLVGLVDPGTTPEREAADKFIFLRNAARRAGLDYLTQDLQNISLSFPDSLESYSDRAERVTSVLDEILRQQPASPPFLH